MILNKQIWLRFSAVVVTILLLLPMAFQALHSLEDHHHEVCHDVSTHIHTKKIDCSLCDFHFSTFTFELAFYAKSLHNFSFSSPQISYFSSEKDIPHFHFTLRGPPLYA